MIQIILAILVAFLLILGQSLWKSGLTANLNHEGGFNIMSAVINTKVIAGVIVYVLATALYMYVITKYKYGTSYALIVAFSLIGATAASVLYFDEKITRLSLFGIILILLGVVLVVIKK